ncbi:MAG: YmdB family metallophosphoesterase [Ruminococcaceae bacterium]|nr:YmdB family metallophosphoesterase [Oscillospiraceae bacterium]
MKILTIGDIVGTRAVDYVADRLFRVKNQLGVDFTVANAENARIATEFQLRRQRLSLRRG